MAGWRCWKCRKCWKCWKWLFLIEAVPSALLGAVILMFLGDGIATARWLGDGQRKLQQRRVDADRMQVEDHSALGAFRNP
jgi:hypothetical protein